MWPHEQNSGNMLYFGKNWSLYEFEGSNFNKLYHFSQLQNWKNSMKCLILQFADIENFILQGSPLQIWPSQKWPLFSKTEITNIFVSMNFYSPWVIEQENPNIDDGYFMWILNFWILYDSLWRFPRSFREFRRVLEIFWDFLRVLESFLKISNEFQRISETLDTFGEFQRVFEIFWDFLRFFEIFE